MAGASLAAAAAALLLATELPQGLLMASGGSTALAELLARSPGARVGGVALKAKERRAGLASVASAASPAGAEARAAVTPVASVLGAAATPEGAVPGFAPGAFPADFVAPGIPVPAAGAPAAGAAPGFGGVPLPAVGGLPIFVPGGGGGGGGGTTPNPGGGTPVPPPISTVPGVVPGIPEPSTWLMLILGFGLTGGAMRRRPRGAIA